LTKDHTFLLEPGNWLGTGTLAFSGTKQTLTFYCRWAVAHAKAPGTLIRCTQTVEIEGGAEQVVNHLRFSQFQGDRFFVELDNALMGKVEGTGLIDAQTLAWEFRDREQDFEGFEVYEQVGENDYKMRAEYASEDNSRTYIECKLWKEKSEQTTLEE